MIKLEKYVLGKETTIKLLNGEKRKAQFAVVELSDIIASHDEKTYELKPSKGYPEVNGVNINSDSCCVEEGARDRVKTVATKLRPTVIASKDETPYGTPISGPVVVRFDGRIHVPKAARKNEPYQ